LNWFGLLMMCVLVEEEGEEASSEGGRQSLLWCPGSPPDGGRRRRPQIRGSTTRGANEKAPNQMADRGLLTDIWHCIRNKRVATSNTRLTSPRRCMPLSLGELGRSASATFCTNVSLAKTESTSHKERGRMPTHPAQWSISPRG